MKILWLFISFLEVTALCSGSLDTWGSRSWSGQQPFFGGIAEGNDHYVAVGAGGTIISSGLDFVWKIGPSLKSIQNGSDPYKDLSTVWLNNVLFLNGQFFALGEQGTILTSSDGVGWSDHSFSTDYEVSGAAYGNGRYVGVGSRGLILVSPDAITWNEAAPVTPTLYDIVFANSHFTAVGKAGSIISSTDGVSWTIENSSTSLTFQAITFGLGQYVAVGLGVIARSDNGYNWNSISTPYTLRGIAAGQSFYVAVGNDGIILKSENGTVWSEQSSGTSAALYGVSCSGGLFTAVGERGTILTSVDGVRWTPRGIDAGNIRAMAYGGAFIGVADGGWVLTSTDGNQWNVLNSSGTSENLLGVAVQDNGGFKKYLAVGTHGKIITSLDATTWRSVDSGTTERLNAVIVANGQFLAVGGSGTILASGDGSTWQIRSSGVSTSLKGLAYDYGKYLAVGSSNVLVSTDSFAWDKITLAASLQLNAIASGNNQFVTVGNAGSIWTSANGTSWVKAVSPLQVDLNAIGFGNGTFLASGLGGSLLSSEDGTNWIARVSGLGSDFSACVYGADSFVVAGTGGAISQCSSVINPFLSEVPGPLGKTISMYGKIGTAYRLQSSSDLLSWSDWQRFTNTQATIRFLDNRTDSMRRFYRAITP